MQSPWISGLWIGLLVAMMTPAQAASPASGGHQQTGETMHRIRMTFEEGVIQAQLEDSAAVRDFLALLPLTLELDDHAATEKVADLPQRLSSKDAPAGFDPSVGDITYYAPWGNLAIFYRDFRYSRGLVKLGRITRGLELLAFSGRKTVAIEVVSAP